MPFRAQANVKPASPQTFRMGARKQRQKMDRNNLNWNYSGWTYGSLLSGQLQKFIHTMKLLIEIL